MNTQVENKIRYTHLRSQVPVLNYADKTFTLVPGSKGGATIAWQYDDVAHQVIYNVSKCSLKDNFCRRVGRAIASGRLNSGRGSVVVPYNVITAGDSPSYKEINTYLANTVSL